MESIKGTNWSEVSIFSQNMKKASPDLVLECLEAQFDAENWLVFKKREFYTNTVKFLKIIMKSFE